MDLALNNQQRLICHKIQTTKQPINIYGTYVTAHNSTNNNVVFFFVSDLKIVYYNNYWSSMTMPWIREENILRLYLETKSFKTEQAKFRRKSNFNNYPQKSQIYLWVYKYQATGSENNLKKKAENPRSGRKLTARCPGNVDAVRDSVGRSPKDSLKRRSQELSLSPASLQRILKKDLQLYP